MIRKCGSILGALLLFGGSICAVCLLFAAFVMIPSESLYTIFTMLVGVLFYALIAYAGYGLSNATGKKTTRTSTSTIEETSYDFDNMMTGSLVAMYKRTHDMIYQQEYVRRLMHLGFLEEQAENLFLFELMILKHDHIADLCSDYLTARLFTLDEPFLRYDDDYYIEHQIFLVSEMVKIWDEAEYYFVMYEGRSAREKMLPDRVYDEICRLSRYGNGELFVNYMGMVSEKSHTSLDLITRYARAEQSLLFAKVWHKNRGEPHPYH